MFMVNQPWRCCTLLAVLVATVLSAASSPTFTDRHRTLVETNICAAAVVESLSARWSSGAATAPGLVCVNATASPAAVELALATDPRCRGPLAPPLLPSSTAAAGSEALLHLDFVQTPAWSNGLIASWMRDAASGPVGEQLRAKFSVAQRPLLPAPYTIDGVDQIRQLIRDAADGSDGGKEYDIFSHDASTTPLVSLAASTKEFGHLPEASCVVSAQPSGPLHPRTYLLMWYRRDVLTGQLLDGTAAATAGGAAATGNASSGSAGTGGGLRPEVPSDWEGLISLLESHSRAVSQQRQKQKQQEQERVAGGSAGVLPPYGLCLTSNPHCGRLGDVLAAIAASVVQIRGSAQGYVYDLDVPPPTAAPLVNGTGWRYAAGVLRRLLAYDAPWNATPALAEAAAQGPPYDCYAVSPLFTSGDCLVTLEWDAALPHMAAAPLLAQPGVLGVAPLPGSRLVAAAEVVGSLRASGAASVPQPELPSPPMSPQPDHQQQQQHEDGGLPLCTWELCACSVNHDLLYGTYGLYSTAVGAVGAAVPSAPTTVAAPWAPGFEPSRHVNDAVSMVEAAAVAALLERDSQQPGGEGDAAAFAAVARAAAQGGQLVNRAPYSAFFDTTVDINFANIVAEGGDISVFATAWEAGGISQMEQRLVRQEATQLLRGAMGVGRRRAAANATTCDIYVRTAWWQLVPYLTDGDSNNSSSNINTGSTAGSGNVGSGGAALPSPSPQPASPQPSPLQTQSADAAVASALAMLTQRGVPYDLARQYLYVIWHAVHHPNAATDIPAPSYPNWFRWALSYAASQMVTSSSAAAAAPSPSSPPNAAVSTRRATQATVDVSTSTGRAMLAAADGSDGADGSTDNASAVDAAAALLTKYFSLAIEVLGPAAVRSVYEASIGAPAWSLHSTPQPSGGGDDIRGGALVGLIVGCQVGVLLLAALMAWVAWRKYGMCGGGGVVGAAAGAAAGASVADMRGIVTGSVTGAGVGFGSKRGPQRQRDFLGRVRAPRVGPDTTLLITDVQNSTGLWEALSVSTMDAALQIHHSTIRKVLAEHDGYESATEGDSFIVAFACPAAATAFATACQLALLEQDWPQELLEHPDGALVAVDPREGQAAASALGVSLYGSITGVGGAAVTTLGSPDRALSGRPALGHSRFISSLLRGSTVGQRLLYGVTSINLRLSSSSLAGDRMKSSVTTPAGAALTAAAASTGQVEILTGPAATAAGPVAASPLGRRRISYDDPAQRSGDGGVGGARMLAAGGALPESELQMPVRLSEDDTSDPTATTRTTPPGLLCGLVAPLSKSTTSTSRLHPGRSNNLNGASLPVRGEGSWAGGGAGSSLTASGLSPENRGLHSNLSVAAAKGSPTLTASASWSSARHTVVAWRDALAAAFPVSPPLPAATAAEVAMLVPSSRGRPVVRLPDGRIVAFRGLRVRMGLHSGLENPRNVAFNKVSSSYQYSGDFAEMTRLVSETAPGGLVVMSGTAFSRLRNSVEQTRMGAKAIKDFTVAYAGHHVIRGAGAVVPAGGAAAATGTDAAASPPLPQDQDEDRGVSFPIVTFPAPSAPSTTPPSVSGLSTALFVGRNSDTPSLTGPSGSTSAPASPFMTRGGAASAATAAAAAGPAKASGGPICEAVERSSGSGGAGASGGSDGEAGGQGSHAGGHNPAGARQSPSGVSPERARAGSVLDPSLGPRSRTHVDLDPSLGPRSRTHVDLDPEPGGGRAGAGDGGGGGGSSSSSGGDGSSAIGAGGGSGTSSSSAGGSSRAANGVIGFAGGDISGGGIRGRGAPGVGSGGAIFEGAVGSIDRVSRPTATAAAAAAALTFDEGPDEGHHSSCSFGDVGDGVVGCRRSGSARRAAADHLVSTAPSVAALDPSDTTAADAEADADAGNVGDRAFLDSGSSLALTVLPPPPTSSVLEQQRQQQQQQQGKANAELEDETEATAEADGKERKDTGEDEAPPELDCRPSCSGTPPPSLLRTHSSRRRSTSFTGPAVNPVAAPSLQVRVCHPDGPGAEANNSQPLQRQSPRLSQVAELREEQYSLGDAAATSGPARPREQEQQQRQQQDGSASDLACPSLRIPSPSQPMPLQFSRSRVATLRHWRSTSVQPQDRGQPAAGAAAAAGPAAGAAAAAASSPPGSPDGDGQDDRELHPATPLYIAVPLGLLCRLALCAPLRSRWVTQVSSLDAPTGSVTVAFVKVVGAATLLADLPGPAAAALDQCQKLVCGLLGGAGGYLVEGCGDGLVLAAFASPAAAVEWALDCVEGLKRLDWDPLLLAHELCEEVVTVGAVHAVHAVPEAAAPAAAFQAMVQPSPPPFTAGGLARSRPGSGVIGPLGVQHAPSSLSSPMQQQPPVLPPQPPASLMRVGSVAMRRQGTTLSRGLRIKVGLDMGPASCTVTDASGRLSYRGKVMNRAARIAGIAAAGQVLCSGPVWEYVAAAAAAPLVSGAPLPPPVAAISLGPMNLKGVKEPVEVLQCVFQS